MLARRRILIVFLTLVGSASLAFAQTGRHPGGRSRWAGENAAASRSDSRVVSRRAIAEPPSGDEFLDAELAAEQFPADATEPTAYMAAQLDVPDPAGPADAPTETAEPLSPTTGPSEYEEESYGPDLEHSYLDAPAPAVSSGEWVKSGWWYTQQSAVYMERSTNVKNSIILATEFQGTVFEHDNPFLQIPLGMGFEPGLRSTFGRYIGRDCRNRDHSVEFTFLGLTHWGVSGGLTSITGDGIFTNIDRSFATAFAVPAFNFSSSQSFDQTSDYNSYEINYRIDRRLSRDRMIYTRNSTWVRQADPALLPSLYAGIRVVSINEHLSWFAESEAQDSFGSYFVTTHNNLVGPQIGADVFYERADWRLGVRAKGGALVNWDSQSTQVRIVDEQGDPLLPDRDEFTKAHDAAFVGELGFVGEYHLGPNFALRFSYDLMWVTNLALAQNQLTFNPATPADISDGHALFYQGLGFGFELVR